MSLTQLYADLIRDMISMDAASSAAEIADELTASGRRFAFQARRPTRSRIPPI